MGGYNATVFRFLNGELLSTSVAEVVDGVVLASNGLWTGNKGTPKFHEDFMRHMDTFGGSPCELYVTPTTEGFTEVFRIGAAAAWAATKASAKRLDARAPAPAAAVQPLA
jgi:hypothetical protein